MWNQRFSCKMCTTHPEKPKNIRGNLKSFSSFHCQTLGIWPDFLLPRLYDSIFESNFMKIGESEHMITSYSISQWKCENQRNRSIRVWERKTKGKLFEFVWCAVDCWEFIAHYIVCFFQSFLNLSLVCLVKKMSQSFPCPQRNDSFMLLLHIWFVQDTMIFHVL